MKTKYSIMAVWLIFIFSYCHAQNCTDLLERKVDEMTSEVTYIGIIQQKGIKSEHGATITITVLISKKHYLLTIRVEKEDFRCIGPYSTMWFKMANGAIGKVYNIITEFKCEPTYSFALGGAGSGIGITTHNHDVLGKELVNQKVMMIRAFGENGSEVDIHLDPAVQEQLQKLVQCGFDTRATNKVWKEK